MVSFFKGFAYAGRGVWRAIYTERNLRFHLCAAFYVVWLSQYYTLTNAEHAALAIVICGVISLELLNTAIEATVDKLQPKWDTAAGNIKDAAAGAVLVFCIGAVFVGIHIFADAQILRAVFNHFIINPWLIALFIISLVFCFWFVFLFGKKKGSKKGE